MENRESRVSQDTIDAVTRVVSIVKDIVNNPKDVEIDVKCSALTMVVSLYTNPDDVGQVIGRNAHLIGSLRSLIAAIAGRNKITIMLEYPTEIDNKRNRNF